MRRILLIACLVSTSSFAQDNDVQRALLLRQQQSDEFALQLRQSQHRLQLSPGDLNQQQSLDTQHLAERQRLENLGAQQQLSAGQGLQRGVAVDRTREGLLQQPFELRLPPPQIRADITPRPKAPAKYFPDYAN